MIPRSPPVIPDSHERYGALIHIPDQPDDFAGGKMCKKAVKHVEPPMRDITDQRKIVSQNGKTLHVELYLFLMRRPENQRRVLVRTAAAIDRREKSS